MLPRGPRTIVLGLDGLDARLTRTLIQAELLPHMKRLAAIGGFRQVISTTPAESAVAWTSFTRGANPGYTNVFDFVGRRLGSYLPYLVGTESHPVDASPSRTTRHGLAAGAGVLGLAGGFITSGRLTRRQWLKGCAAIGTAGVLTAGVGVPLTRWWPQQRDRVKSTVQGEPWWDLLASEGQRCTALRMPMAYPAQAHANVRLLAGLGVPDIFGTQGTYRLLSDAPEDLSANAVLAIVWEANRAHVSVPGPRNPLDESRTVTATLQLERTDSGHLSVGSDHQVQDLERGQWSAPIRLAFRFSPLLQRKAVTRLYFCEDERSVRIYMIPLQFDPADPPVANPISSPPELAATLHRRTGDYHTLGWESQTAGLVADVLDEAAYLAEAHQTLATNEAQLLSELERDEWDQFMFVVQASDQMSHMCLDDAAETMRKGGIVDSSHAMVKLYQRLDDLVGRVADQARVANARLIVMSDHGFARFRRSINLNTWLAQRGYLALTDRDHWDDPSAQSVLGGEVWSNVDWFNTRAFALGLGGIYLNVAEREPHGIVKRAGEYEFLQRRLIHDLKAWRDPATEEPVFANVYRRQDIYEGRYVEHAPDLILGLREGYRVSSSTVVGGIPEGVIHDNRSPWRADHCGVDAVLIPGICLTNFANDWPQRIPIAALARGIWPVLSDSPMPRTGKNPVQFLTGLA